MGIAIGNMASGGRVGRGPQGEGGGPILGESPAMKSTLRTISRIAAADETVLITGESGTGKELVAHLVSSQSKRAAGDFIVINCAAIPEGLLESELFGHERGAFTGAYRQNVGRLEMAQGGVVLLDEIGEMALSLQAKLLRFIENRAIERIGTNRPRKVDVRIVAATNRDLKKAVEQGLFREDLYYRLNVLHVNLPPLRERGKDVLLLAEHMLGLYAKEIAKKLAGFDAAAQKALLHHGWPGNVRELINRVKRAAVLADGSWITAKDLDLSEAVPIRPGSGLRQARQNLEADCLREALATSGGKVTECARLLQISRSQIYHLLKKHGLSRKPE
ncbi:MAG: sigma-54 dependent transcriptional regulator [Pseudomonadota bacterium]